MDDRQVLNINLDQIAWMRAALRCKSNEALRVLQLYGYLEHATSGGNAVNFKQAVYSEKTGFTRDTIRHDLKTMAERGWIEVFGETNGTTVEVFRIPFDQVMTSQSSVTSSSSADDEQVASKVASRSSTLKKSSKKPPTEEKKKAPTLQEQLIQAWNDSKPQAWPTLKSISPSRERSIKALGGYRAVIDLLPDALRGAKANQFWATKAITWENIVGSGTTPKGHLHSLAEAAPAAGTSSNKGSYVVEHADFFAPDPKTGDMRPKHGFASPEERKAAEASARAFYSQRTEG